MATRHRTPLLGALSAVASLAGLAAAPSPPLANGCFWVWDGRPGAASLHVRQRFTLTAAPTAAEGLFASRGSLAVTVNGTEVLRAPGGRQTYRVGLAGRLLSGRNVVAIGARAGAGGGGVAFLITARLPDGRTVVVRSNGDERVVSSASPGWAGAAFDDRAWPLARTLTAWDPSGARPAPPATSPTPPARPRRPSPPEQVPGPAARPPAADVVAYDPARIVRVWDIRAGGAADQNPYTRPRGSGERMLLTTSLPPAADMAVVRAAGFTLLQTDSDHLSTEEIAPGQWSFAGPDAAYRAARDQGFDWCYFPHYAFPPRWYAASVPFTRIRCLEHDRTVEAFSPWEPRFGPFMARGYERLAAQYGPSSQRRAAALYLGVHGDYGECGLLMGARVSVPGQREDWQRRFGDLHDHLGWWCADPLARAAFRTAMMQKYGSIEVLNAAWHTRYRAADDIAYPGSPRGAARRHWLDFVQWYLNSTSSLVDAVSRVARRSFPDALLMLPAGFGDENPRGGEDNSMIARIAARNQVDVRSTHGGFRPVAENQASMLGRLASACRFYGAPLWTEPPSSIDADQEVGRIFEAASLGARGIFDWSSNVVANREVYYRYGRFLRVGQPVVDVAMIYPTTSHLLTPDVGYPPTFLKGCTAVRDVLNYDVVDERMVRDGALERYRVAVLWEGTIYEADTLERLRRWVEGGGVLAAYDFGKIETVEGDQGWFRDLFGHAGRLAPAVVNRRFVTEPGATPPLHYRINVGQSDAVTFLQGDWYDGESLGGVARRWTGADAAVNAPVAPGQRYTLTVRASVPPEAARRRREVLVNDVRVGELGTAAETTYRFAVPPAAIEGRPVARVTLRSETWVPANVLRDSADRRALGAWVTYVQMDAADAAPATADPGPPRGRIEATIDLRRVRSDWARAHGRGWCVYFPARRDRLEGYYELLRYLAYHLSDLDPAQSDGIVVDDAWDGVYATLQRDRVLYYNPGTSPVLRTIVLSPSAFAAHPELTTPTSYTHTLTVPAAAITSIELAGPPQEMLLQCEGFTVLGRLQPSTGPTLSPGAGPTHVLVPVGGSVATRFRAPVAGVYRIFYRAIRRGGPARAEVLVDGHAPEGPQRPTAAGGAPATTEAGSMRLDAGVHTLTLKPRLGEDLRADYVILSTDPGVAGYAFAPRVPGAR
ncbi:MAG: hypothetical protein IT208_13435 [Chthonomonadales bacterium]|nr:hypothetical protein [Chthonomonadales bacterium]